MHAQGQSRLRYDDEIARRRPAARFTYSSSSSSACSASSDAAFDRALQIRMLPAAAVTRSKVAATTSSAGCGDQQHQGGASCRGGDCQQRQHRRMGGHEAVRLAVHPQAPPGPRRNRPERPEQCVQEDLAEPIGGQLAGAGVTIFGDLAPVQRADWVARLAPDCRRQRVGQREGKPVARREQQGENCDAGAQPGAGADQAQSDGGQYRPIDARELAAGGERDQASARARPARRTGTGPPSAPAPPTTGTPRCRPARRRRRAARAARRPAPPASPAPDAVPAEAACAAGPASRARSASAPRGRK